MGQLWYGLAISSHGNIHLTSQLKIYLTAHSAISPPNGRHRHNVLQKMPRT